jgi:hypothetical protein
MVWCGAFDPCRSSANQRIEAEQSPHWYEVSGARREVFVIALFVLFLNDFWMEIVLLYEAQLSRLNLCYTDFGIG